MTYFSPLVRLDIESRMSGGVARPLFELTDRQLRDIGIERDQIKLAVEKLFRRAPKVAKPA